MISSLNFCLGRPTWTPAPLSSPLCCELGLFLVRLPFFIFHSSLLLCPSVDSPVESQSLLHHPCYISHSPETPRTSVLSSPSPSSSARCPPEFGERPFHMANVGHFGPSGTSGDMLSWPCTGWRRRAHGFGEPLAASRQLAMALITSIMRVHQCRARASPHPA